MIAHLPRRRSPRSTRPGRRATGAAALLALVLGAGCSAEINIDDPGSDGEGSGSVSADDLAAQLDPQLQEQKGAQARVEDLACDGDLAAEVGAEQRCHFTDRLGDRYGLTVTVSEVEAEGDGLTFDFAVDPGQTLEPDELEPELVSELTKVGGGVPPDDVSCPGDLPGVVGESLVCILTAGPDRLETTVTVTSAEGPAVRFDVQVADEVLP